MAKRDILTDANLLHQKSVACNPNAVDDLIVDLCESVPEKDLGLAAPQIGVLQRVFVANLSRGRYVFVNPRITFLGTDMLPSEEGCLSVPGVSRCVERVGRLEIDADVILPWQISQQQVIIGSKISGPMRLENLDACIVQHENDHLNGVLLTDLPTTLTREERLQKKQIDRARKLQMQRAARKAPPPKPQAVVSKPVSKTEFLKAKKRARKHRQRELKRIAIAEQYMASKQGLFDPQSSSDNSQNTDQGNSIPEANTSLA